MMLHAAPKGSAWASPRPSRKRSKTLGRAILLPDESRTNVYKLFRATRTGPDSPIDPAKRPPAHQQSPRADKGGPESFIRVCIYQRLSMRPYGRRPFGKGAKSMISSSWKGFGWPWVSGVGSSRGGRSQARCRGQATIAKRPSKRLMIYLRNFEPQKSG